MKEILMKEIKTAIEMKASPANIWQVLLDFENYPEWNPFIKRFSGVPEVGAKIKVIIHSPGQREMMFNPRLLKVKENKELRWIGHMIFPGLCDGEHALIIESIDEFRVNFRQEERLSGILVPIFWKSLYHHTRAGFNEMNQALKMRVEKI
jgi:hypothetical protein